MAIAVSLVRAALQNPMDAGSTTMLVITGMTERRWVEGARKASELSRDMAWDRKTLSEIVLPGLQTERILQDHGTS